MKRVWFLDLLRSIAVTAVVVFHCLPVVDDGGLSGVVARVVESLWWGVDLFFVLSGFLITSLLLQTRSASNRLTTFLARRSLRIFPLYFTWLIIVFGVNALASRESISVLRPHIPYFASYTTNIWMRLAEGKVRKAGLLWAAGGSESGSESVPASRANVRPSSQPRNRDHRTNKERELKGR